MNNYLFNSLKTTFIGAILATSCLISCKPEEKTPQPSLTIPSTYDTTNFSLNTINEKTIKINFSDLVAEAKRGRIITNIVTESVLKAKYDNTSTYKIESLTNTNYKTIVTNSITELANSSGNNYIPSDTIPATGGVYGGYLFNKYGLEPEQLIDKGLFQALLYNQVLLIMSQPLTEASIDKILVLWGGTTQFANQDVTTKTTFPDVNVAKYSARRDKNEPSKPGYYLQIKNNLIKAKAAIKAGSQFNNDRDVALNEIKLLWEKSIASTVINYCKTSATTLSKTTKTANDYGSAMHALSENIGFLAGFKGIADKKITDAQIETILTLFYAPSAGPTQFYKYKTSTFDALTNLATIQSNLKAIYGFSDTEMSDFGNSYTTTR